MGIRKYIPSDRNTEMQSVLRNAVEVGISVGVVLAIVGVGQTLIRLAAARRLAENPDDVNAKAALLMF
jgi:F0F1-type ATP synthase membrane subunit c/vacuolar-type H+-ATPase subunit K